jgi:hypothetical protein
MFPGGLTPARKELALCAFAKTVARPGAPADAIDVAAGPRVPGRGTGPVAVDTCKGIRPVILDGSRA